MQGWCRNGQDLFAPAYKRDNENTYGVTTQHPSSTDRTSTVGDPAGLMLVSQRKRSKHPDGFPWGLLMIGVAGFAGGQTNLQPSNTNGRNSPTCEPVWKRTEIPADSKRPQVSGSSYSLRGWAETMTDKVAGALALLVVVFLLMVWEQITAAVPAQFVTGSMNGMVLIAVLIVEVIAYAWMHKERSI